MIFEYLKLNLNIKDEEFDVIYPHHIRKLTSTHWTPLLVAKIAAEYLAFKPGIKVLDIGSGVGKFCMAGSAHTGGYFVGVEQRESLYKLSASLSKSYKLNNVEFIHSNIIDIKFDEYQSFYFFNPFYEYLDPSSDTDYSVQSDQNLYLAYSEYVRAQLALMPKGTRIATYWESTSIIPEHYDLQFSRIGGLLNMWEKIY